jgi:peptidoglycan/xylan/chitin deacetylase (PgdA/CDA1 family)
MNFFPFKYLMSRVFSNILENTLSNNNECRILMYHSLCASIDMNKNRYGIYQMGESSFKEQMSFLVKSKNNYFSSLYEWNKNPKNLIITFDDGYLDTLLIAAPILMEHKIPFSVFISPGLIESNNKKYMCKQDLIELSKMDGCIIGSHGYSHFQLTKCNDKLLKSELINSKHWLEDTLSIPVDTMSYPHGMVDQRVRDFVCEADYKIAVSSRPGGNSKNKDSLCLNRTDIWSIDNLKTFNQKVNGYWDWMEWIN